MNREKIDLTSVSVIVLILGKKGRDLEQEIEIFGEKLGAGYLTSVTVSVFDFGKK